MTRYSRQISLPEIGEAGMESKVRGSVGTERGRTVGAAAMR